MTANLHNMASITSLQTNTNGEDSLGIINTNFSNLNTDKLEKSGGTLTGKVSFSGTTHAGIRLINLTTAQRDALTAQIGDKIFNTTTDQEEVYTSSGWVAPTGASDATTSVKGVSELATSTEIDNGTATGGTGAGLAVSPDQLALSKYSTQLPTSDEKAAMTAANSPASDNAFITSNDGAESGSSKFIKSKSNSKIDDSLVGASSAGDMIYSDGTDLQRLAIGTTDQVVGVNATGTAPAWVYNGNYTPWREYMVTGYDLVEDFTASDIGSYPEPLTNTPLSITWKDSSGGGYGGKQYYTEKIIDSTKDFDLQLRAKIGLSSQSLTFGLYNITGGTAVDSSTVLDGAYFIINTSIISRTTDGSSGTNNTISSGITTTDYNNYRLVRRGSNIYFYINEVLKSTHTTNLPDITTSAFFVQITKSSGATTPVSSIVKSSLLFKANF